MLGMRSLNLAKRAKRVREVANDFLRKNGRPESLEEPIFLDKDKQRVGPKDASRAQLKTNLFGSFIWIIVKRLGKPEVCYSGHLTIRTAEGLAEELKRAGHFFLPVKIKQV